jgi:iodotyrosine deiodinase
MAETLLPFPPLPALSDAERVARAEAFRALMASRHSCRQFTRRAVPEAAISAAIAAAASGPSGANHQPWFFACVRSAEVKARIRAAAEEEERAFYAGRAPDEWLEALAPLGTDAEKPHLEDADVLIVIFAQRRGGPAPGEDRQNYYVTESVGIATGLLIAALHSAGLATLTHTPAPMRFLNSLCGRPETEKPFLILAVGHPAPEARLPAHAARRKPLDSVMAWL